MEWQNLVDLADNFGVLVLSLYIIQNGMTQMRELIQQNNAFMQTVLSQQQTNNEQLATMFEKLCQK